MSYFESFKNNSTVKRVAVLLWWLPHLMIFVTLSIVAIDYNDPEIVPIVSATLGAFFFFMFTRHKGKHDASERACHSSFMDRMSQEYVANEIYNRRNHKGDVEKLTYDIGTVRYQVQKLEHEIKEIKFSASEGSRFTNVFISKSPLATAAGAPMRPIGQAGIFQTNPESYGKAARIYRDNIEYHQRMSARYGRLEEIAIYYTAFFTIFGGELVRWFNS